MTPTAIHQAIRLNKYPEEMAWICQSSALIPNEVTELLRVCSSNEKIKEFASQNHTDENELLSVLLNFIDNVLLSKDSSNEKILGLSEDYDPELRKLHFKLLINIYHPDRNSSPDAAYQTSRITKANHKLKNESPSSEYKNIRISRVPPKSFYTATNQAEKQISSLRNVMTAVFAITVASVIFIGGYLYEPSKQELFSDVSKPIKTEAARLTQIQDDINAEISPFQMALKTSIADDNNNLDQLHSLISSIESAYEKGDASNIQRILTSPEIKEQSDKEVKSKLENLFRITSKRKMLLYDFEWNNLSGQIHGKGKFLSRYYLNGQNQWLTREGIANLQISQTDTELNITSLKLDNKNIDQ